jgi:hypothetical protein
MFIFIMLDKSFDFHSHDRHFSVAFEIGLGHIPPRRRNEQRPSGSAHYPEPME